MASSEVPFASFLLSSEQCEILSLFQSHPSIPALAKAMRRDVSSISRQLTQLAELAPVLEKRQGRWRLTERGRRVAIWSQEAARAQRKLLEDSPRLRLVSTREFSARVLAPRLAEWVPGFPRTRVSLLAQEDGVEAALLGGYADIGFDCGRSKDPDVRFRALTREPFCVVAAPKMAAVVQKNRKSSFSSDRLLSLPHLAYDRIRSGDVLGLSREIPQISAIFNDIASTRSACVAGLGWAVLPAYTVRDEIERGELIALTGDIGRAESFGVFWLSSRPAISAWVRSASAWLSKVSLNLRASSNAMGRVSLAADSP